MFGNANWVEPPVLDSLSITWVDHENGLGNGISYTYYIYYDYD